MRVKNMEKMTSVMLMLLMLGIFLQSSQALNCYVCLNCEQDTTQTKDCGDVCVKARRKINGAL